MNTYHAQKVNIAWRCDRG